MTKTLRQVTGGVDTHADTHTAAVIDELGRSLGHEQFLTDPAGCRSLRRVWGEFGRPARICSRSARILRAGSALGCANE